MTTPDLNAIIQLAAIVAEQNSAPEPEASPAHMREDELPDLLTLTETAQYLRVRPKTLRNWSSLGKGPKTLRLGGRVVYRRADVLAFRDNQAVAA
ncbi:MULTISPECIES: helix-turn-helix transcriptional regulator [unclassified Microbacterium]|uniref:helix-turn-helix transcriptional regulator n=1 Tax=unclassified Microbacterium TaxID=2609290 RepID=UPI001F0E5A0A|nr:MULTISPECIES: helix-turn-helix domain-containing protein [unclassified Microbacterium]